LHHDCLFIARSLRCLLELCSFEIMMSVLLSVQMAREMLTSASYVTTHRDVPINRLRYTCAYRSQLALHTVTVSRSPNTSNDARAASSTAIFCKTRVREMTS
jgi:hypothetical protein